MGFPIEQLDANSFLGMKIIIGASDFVQTSLPKMLKGHPGTARERIDLAEALLHSYLDGELEAAMSRPQRTAAVKVLLKLAVDVRK